MAIGSIGPSLPFEAGPNGLTPPPFSVTVSLVGTLATFSPDYVLLSLPPSPQGQILRTAGPALPFTPKLAGSLISLGNIIPLTGILGTFSSAAISAYTPVTLTGKVLSSVGPSLPFKPTPFGYTKPAGNLTLALTGIPLSLITNNLFVAAPTVGSPIAQQFGPAFDFQPSPRALYQAANNGIAGISASALSLFTSSLVAEADIPLTSTLISGSTGSLAVGGNVIASLTGSVIATGIGSVINTPTIVPSGTQLNTNIGIFAVSWDTTLVGTQVTISQTTIVAQPTNALSSISSNFAAGAISGILGDKTITISGTQFAVFSGFLQVARSTQTGTGKTHGKFSTNAITGTFSTSATQGGFTTNTTLGRIS